MPWTPKQASAKTHKADSAPKQKQWSEVANAVLAKTHDDKRAIMEANAVVRDHPARRMHGDGTGHYSGH